MAVVSDQEPKIDFENMPAPAEGILVTHFLIVRDVARSRAFYTDVLGGQVVIDENPLAKKRPRGPARVKVTDGSLTRYRVTVPVKVSRPSP